MQVTNEVDKVSKTKLRIAVYSGLGLHGGPVIEGLWCE